MFAPGCSGYRHEQRVYNDDNSWRANLFHCLDMFFALHTWTLCKEY